MARAETSERVGAATRDGLRPVTLETPRGELHLRWYEAPGSERAVACVGGVGDRWDSPARGLYPALCDEWRRRGVHGLRVRFTDAMDFGSCVRDLLAGADFLLARDVGMFALVGHSLGGAVAIRAGTMLPGTRTVIALATQDYGANPAELPPQTSLLLVHGDDDRILPPDASARVYMAAHEPKRLEILPGAGHVLDEVSETVHDIVRSWLERGLA